MPPIPFEEPRRRVIKWIGLIAAAPAVGRAPLAFGQSAGAPPLKGQPAAAAPPSAPEPPAEISPQARSLAEVVRARYGDHLDDAQLQEVTKDLDRVVKNGERLRAAKLANADEPDFTFGAAVER
jgi:hypothetical protein